MLYFGTKSTFASKTKEPLYNTTVSTYSLRKRRPLATLLNEPSFLIPSSSCMGFVCYRDLTAHTYALWNPLSEERPTVVQYPSDIFVDTVLKGMYNCLFYDKQKEYFGLVLFSTHKVEGQTHKEEGQMFRFGIINFKTKTCEVLVQWGMFNPILQHNGVVVEGVPHWLTSSGIFFFNAYRKEFQEVAHGLSFELIQGMGNVNGSLCLLGMKNGISELWVQQDCDTWDLVRKFSLQKSPLFPLCLFEGTLWLVDPWYSDLYFVSEDSSIRRKRSKWFHEFWLAWDVTKFVILNELPPEVKAEQLEIEIDDFLLKSCSSLGMDHGSITAAQTALEKIQKSDEIDARTRSRQHKSIVAGVIYLITQLSKREKKQPTIQAIGHATGVGKETIRKTYKGLQDHAVTILPSWFAKL